ncbi:hypothetical protein H8B02_40595 [Bradyrhizobium sp. Pear77]|uniref:hypothetical protein n=1 Tax=Bradyrhizobium altum TaxID=1571202 RepID=UPI001E403BAE|nr:hypothetical protein [Bradyrhizobium altum]MCC8959482.1 hypothetical protein [Bradyrhizobium altum]
MLVDESGAMLGKIAHIEAAQEGGPRFNSKMSNEARRSFNNLLLVCGKHDDIIDYRPNVETYTAQTLRRFRKEHEDRFRRAERQLLEQFTDTTQASQPSYPKTLKSLADVTKSDGLAETQEEIDGICQFIDKLKELPLQQRDFAIKLAERMRRQNTDKLLVEDVMGAFQIGSTKLKDCMRVLEAHNLGWINEGHNYREYFVEFAGRHP